MREIKFRAWDKECYQKELAMCGWEEMFKVTINGIFKNNRYELMQYTGLHDKNGKEIYEGDIVSYQFESMFGFGKKKVIYTVIFEDGQFSTTHLKFNDKTSLAWYRLHQKEMDIEVIGNIYENPELIEDNK